jgi:hypothetical protein
MINYKQCMLAGATLAMCFTLANCNKDEPASNGSENNYLCVITSNQYLAPSSLATEVYRGFVESKAACDQILAEFQSGARP